MLNKEKQTKNKKIIFGDNGEIIAQKRKKEQKIYKQNSDNGITKDSDKKEIGQKWYDFYPEFNIIDDIVEMKDSEQQSLQDICQKAYEDELPNFLKKNPPDSSWLETALHRGTSKDRGNAGALLLTTNPLANLSTLETIIGFAKLSNKSNSDVIAILTELFMEVLLPSNRKLISLQLRGASWKLLKKQDCLSKENKNKIYSFWNFENKLKELYFEYLKNLQNCLQSGQDSNKNCAIISASKLLAFAPEKEQMILSMLINKLGDPSNKVAAKVLHHLSEVSYKHPNMCGVITKEAEKLLFRNNISERAQHFALCFLGQILPPGFPDVSTKTVNICFSLFKVLVKKGAVNNKTMQAILRCLQKAIKDAEPPKGEQEILTKDMQNTIYRLVHLADIKISIQTLSLLLEIVSIKSEKCDRFYNALYLKLTDLDLINIGNTTATQFLHIVHKSMHRDKNIPRIKAFIKRLLQIALYLPANFACGCLIVINKVLKTRKDVLRETTSDSLNNKEISSDQPKSFDVNIYKVSIDEENESHLKETVGDESTSNHDLKVEPESNKNKYELFKLTYDAYHRVPAFSGAEKIEKWELLQLQEHYHPSLKLFAQNILNMEKIAYYGDPLRDFGLPYFLERFCFKNPKKQNENKIHDEDINRHHKHYTPYGGRNINVKNLTKESCTEDEFFIFNYLEKKRDLQIQNVKKKDEQDVGDDVDDDEFEDYLDGLVKQTKKKAGVEDDEEFEIDYMKELGSEIGLNEGKKCSKKSKKRDESDDELMDDWGEDDEDISNELESDGGSISLEGSDDENEANNDESFEEEDEFSDDKIESDSDEPKMKKSKYEKSFKNFTSVLKEKKDMKSLFAAVDDFADILEEAGNIKDHGTTKEVFNRDKASDKQLKWEEKRRSNYKDGKSWKKIRLNQSKGGKKIKTRRMKEKPKRK